MRLDDAKRAWRSGGFTIAPGHLDLARFVERAAPRRPVHRFWTAETCYPGLDHTSWAGAL